MKIPQSRRGPNTRFVSFFLVSCLAVCFTAFAARQEGYRVNTTPSVPVGLWRIAGKAEKNGYVFVTAFEHPGYRMAAERGYLTDGKAMVKRVVATEGDLVSYDASERAVTVNGAYIPMTEILSRDTEGRDLPAASFPRRLVSGEAWLSSENVRGYDSRYFGPVPLEALQGARLLWEF